MENVIEFPDIEVIEDEAALWIVRLEGDERPSPQDIADFKAWMARSATHKEVLLQMAGNWNDMDLLSELMIPGEVAKSERSWWQSLGLFMASPFLLLCSLKDWCFEPGRGARPYYAMASLLLSFGLVLAVVASQSWQQLFEQEQRFVYLTEVGEQASYPLPDGSVLQLNTKSRIEVIYTAAKRQLILHEGEAYFDVFSNPDRPFEVYAGERMVRAVGTAFTVFWDQQQLKVTVTEGKVNVSALASLDGETGHNIAGSDAAMLAAKQTSLGSLVAGQSVAMPKGSQIAIDKILTIEAQEMQRQMAWTEGQLVFDGETLEEVVREVSRYTPIKIEVVDPALKAVRIGGQFKVGEVDALFDVLESGFGITISRLDKQHIQLRGDE